MPSTSDSMDQRYSHRAARYYSRQARVERLIATARLALSVCFLGALYLDPSEPVIYADITFTILVGYLLYAVILAAAAWRLGEQGRGFRLITQGFDLMIFAAIMFLTQGPTSPFFVFFIFSLLCAAIRWQWKGTLWTIIIALTVVIGMAFYPTYFLADPEFETNRFIIRVVYLAVMGGLFGYVTVHAQNLHRDLSHLAAWPNNDPTNVADLHRKMLEHAAVIFDSTRLLLAWEDEEGPILHLASWARNTFQYTREPFNLFGTLVAEPVGGISFFCLDARGPKAPVICDFPSGLGKWQGSPLDKRLQERFAVKAVLALKLPREGPGGYLFVLDKRRMTTDDFMLGGIVAREIAARLSYCNLLKRLQGVAAAEERVRLARDLHDGLLQSLTSASLQLEAVHRLMETDPQAAQKGLLEVQTQIVAEGRDLRFQIRDLKPHYPGLLKKEDPLPARLTALAEQIKRQWGLRAEIDWRLQERDIPHSEGQQIYFIVHESMINAARHAGASRVRAELSIKAGRLCIAVGDDGCGFPFQGRYDHALLAEMNLGPTTLRERIESLGGSLTIDSSNTGARLEIILPFQEKGA